VIARGVAAGETVVTDGQLRLVPGARVQVKTATAEAPAP
jgi:multidrug efflux system membrane fusion protein